MAVLWFEGFESGNPTFDGGVDQVLGTFGTTAPVTQNTVFRNGSYALRTNPTTTGNSYLSIGKLGNDGRRIALNIATLVYYRFYFRANTLPSTGREAICAFMNNSAGFMQNVKLTSAGKLELYNSSNVLVAAGTATILANTWYRIEGICSRGTSALAEVRVDGVVDITSSTVNQTTININDFQIGKVFNTSGQTVDFYYDDVQLDDAAYPGPGGVYPCVVNANTAQADWNQGTATSFTEIDETPRSDTDYIASNGANTESRFQINTGTLPASMLVYGVRLSAAVRESVATTSSFKPLMDYTGTQVEISTGFNAGVTTQECDLLRTLAPNGNTWDFNLIQSTTYGVKEYTAAAAGAVRCTRLKVYVSARDLNLDPQLPTLTVGTAANITSTSIDIDGEVVSQGEAAVTERGFVYNTTGAPTTADTKVIVGSGVGIFSTTLSGLTPGTDYYIRSYAINSFGTAYSGADAQGTTLAAANAHKITLLGCG